ncbi:MAG: hypothetical protein V4579_05940 [Pseudomonadota bacterium]
MADSMKRLIVTGMSLVVVLGIFVAFSNLPVVTGCGFYGQCGAPDGE